MNLMKLRDHFVVYKENHPIGAGRIRESDSGIGKVERVCILPEFRGIHLGKAYYAST